MLEHVDCLCLTETSTLQRCHTKSQRDQDPSCCVICESHTISQRDHDPSCCLTCESHTLMVVSFEAEYSSPSPPHRTQLTASVWLDMLNRHCSVTWHKSASRGCQRPNQLRFAACRLDQSDCERSERGKVKIARTSQDGEPKMPYRVPHAQRLVLRAADKAACWQRPVRRLPRDRRHPLGVTLQRMHCHSMTPCFVRLSDHAPGNVPAGVA